MRIHHIALAGLALTAATASRPAQAQTVTATNPDSVAAVLRDKGLAPEMLKDSAGDPRIRSTYQGRTFNVFFYGCTDNVNCSTVAFSQGIDLSKPISWTTINASNKDHLFTRIWFDDEGDPYIEMDVNLDFGGMSAAAFAGHVDLWLSGLSKFKAITTE